LRESLAGHDEAILDPLDTCCLAARGGTRQAASGWSMRVVRGCGVCVRHPGSNASRPWQLQPLIAYSRAKSAEVCAEAPNGGLELRDAAQQYGSAEIGAHTRILSKSGQLSKCGKWSQSAPPAGDRGGGPQFVLTNGEPSLEPAVPALKNGLLLMLCR
jgi:hypothetical protein